MMSPEEIRANADCIYVREEINGKVVVVTLSELPEDRIAWWIAKWQADQPK